MLLSYFGGKQKRDKIEGTIMSCVLNKWLLLQGKTLIKHYMHLDVFTHQHVKNNQNIHLSVNSFSALISFVVMQY